MQRWLAQIHKADLTVAQVQAKIRLLHELCEAQADLIGALIEPMVPQHKRPCQDGRAHERGEEENTGGCFVTRCRRCKVMLDLTYD